MHKNKKTSKTEAGVASILVVLTLMTLLALISISFSKLMSREVRQSLDRQLSTAAYFAAESGINDARHYLTATGAPAPINGCDTPGGDQSFVQNGDISGDGDIPGHGTFKYSCVIADPAPKELQYDIPAGESIVVKLSGASLASLNRLYFSWRNSTDYSPSAQPLGVYSQLPQQIGLGQNKTGLLRVGLYPMVTGCNDFDSHGDRNKRFNESLGGISDSTNAIVECASRNYFMYPSVANNTTDTPNCSYNNITLSRGCVRYNNPGNDGAVVPGNCKDPFQKPDTSYSPQANAGYCNTVISDLLPVNAAAPPNTAASYYLRLTAVYQSIRVYVQATDNASSPNPNALKISDAEALIDVTGTGNDIFRRISTKAPLQDDVPPPNYGLQSMESICKLFRVPVMASGQYGQAFFDGSESTFNDDNGGTNCDKPIGSTFIDPGNIAGIGEYPSPQINDFTASPSSFTEGESHVISLHWSADHADYCQPSGGPWNTPNPDPEGDGTSNGPISATTTFSVTCYGPSGLTKSRDVTVNVSAQPSVQLCSESQADGYGNCQTYTGEVDVLDQTASSIKFNLNPGQQLLIYDYEDLGCNPGAPNYPCPYSCSIIYGNVGDLGSAYPNNPDSPLYTQSWNNAIKSIDFYTPADHGGQNRAGCLDATY